ncbi:hypothetical protein BRPE64_DCDS10860 (plasmid) [Caballeronia insecticola]|uniref:Uncharacterized protein n=1 Tax=Caballeronia insecticola TaxID=758793 RepID=R4X599_9BURK|nr:hypothetical protein BRPE64_DCDS10860 [Caballeronia insecticola]
MVVWNLNKYVGATAKICIGKWPDFFLFFYRSRPCLTGV